jgi:hypothetical protein
LVKKPAPRWKGLMTESDGGSPAGAPGAAHYIASLTQELAELAKTYELEALAYILDMARLEADQICKRGDGSKPFGSETII